jgi:TolB-like protein/cytochrome c-type biogenesis protein CcmH/NrfG
MVNKEILDSWKEISQYLGRDIRTCSRWEKELGLPVHRIDSASTRSKVFAYKSEIDEWLETKSKQKELKKKPFFKNQYFIYAVVSFFIILSGVFAYLYFNQKKAGSLKSSISIAVFPIKNPGSSLDQKYFSQGITRELINHLALNSKISVISPYNPGAVENFEENIKDIGEELGSKYLLTGDLIKTEDKIKLDLNLFETKKGTLVWDKAYEDTMNDFPTLREMICLDILKKLKIEVNQDYLSRVASGISYNEDAVKTYMKGNFLLGNLYRDSDDPWEIYHQGQYFSNLNSEETNNLAIELFFRVTEIEPGFAPAYLGIADCYTNMFNFGWSDDINLLKDAEYLLEKAQEISPNLPGYFNTRAKINLLEYMGSDQDTRETTFELLKEGIKLYPNDPRIISKLAYYHFLEFGEKGRESDFEKAIDYMKKSSWMSPDDSKNVFIAELFMLNGDFYKALLACEQFVPKSQSLEYRLAEIYYYMGELDRSHAIFQKSAGQLKDDTYVLAFLGMIAAQKGDYGEAKRTLERLNLVPLRKELYTWHHLRLASIYMGIGMEQKGYEILDSVFKNPDINKFRYIYTRYMDIDRNFDIIRDKEEYKNIIKGEEYGAKQVN